MKRPARGGARHLMEWSGARGGARHLMEWSGARRGARHLMEWSGARGGARHLMEWRRCQALYGVAAAVDRRWRSSDAWWRQRCPSPAPTLIEALSMTLLSTSARGAAKLLCGSLLGIRGVECRRSPLSCCSTLLLKRTIPPPATPPPWCLGSGFDCRWGHH